jgi:ubiquinone/menaquinone biosynthesis C-methylase UbiE
MSGRRAASADPQSFDSFAASYDRRDELNGGWVTEWLTGVLADRRGVSAIELGCGSGRVATLLAEHYDRVRAVDLSPEMIRIARSKHSHPRIVFEQGDLTQITGRYDLVVSIMTLHHVPDLTKTLEQLSSLVAPGGAAILVDAAQPPKPRWMFHVGNLLRLASDIRHRHRFAWERFRLNSDRKWIDHKVSDRFLSPEEFVRTYEQAFPGAAVAPVSGLYTAVWERLDNSIIEPTARSELHRTQP